ncbi:MAG: Rpn family recombination-promoting nuclease/putative transposase [Desulfobacterales bacterium]|nr:Rpn family recombination-promoting nuclease/putative transposase [Desulfobacterales bacterium]
MEKVIRFDWAIKHILRNKANFDVLEGFLSALLEDEEIKVLKLLESEGNQEEEDSKFNRVDIMIEDSQHRKIIVEIQNCREVDYLERLLYGTSKIIVENQKLGEDFQNLSKVISISVMYFNLGLGDDYLYYGATDFKGMNTGHSLKIRKRVELGCEDLEKKYKLIDKKIFPEYYLIQVERYHNQVRKAIDEWIYMIKNNEIKEGSKSRNIDKAKEKLSEMNMSKEEKARYERYLMNLAIERNVVNTAKEEGIEEGRKEGREEGLKEGMEEGRKAIVISMIKTGVPIETISKYTGLSIDKIKQYCDEL